MHVSWKTLALGAALLPTHAMALVAPTTEHAEALHADRAVVRPSLVDSVAESTLGASVTVRRDALTGAARLLSGGRFAGVATLAPGASRAAYVEAARAFVAAHRDVFGVDAADLDLIDASVLLDGEDQFLSFSVRRDGLRIDDARVAFRFKRGALVQVMTRTYAEAASDTRPDAQSLATPEGFTAAKAEGDALRVVATETGYRLVRVKKLAAERAGEAMHVQLEAATGEVWQALPARHWFGAGRAEAKSYARTYYQSTAESVPLSEVNLQQGGNSIQTSLTGAFEASGAATMNGFRGRRIDVSPRTGSAVRATAVADGSGWLLSVAGTAEKEIAQAHTYRHLNLVVAKAKNYITTPWFDRSLRANVNLSQTCNAYWDGSSVNFFSAGGGCGNTGLISDVMYHEWGHGLDENTGGIDDGAYSEGFGDIVSLVMTRDPILGPGFRTNGGAVRDLQPDKVYPRDRGEVHAEGLIIGSTFWDLYDALKTKYDADRANDLIARYAFKTIFTATNYTDVYDAALAVDDDDGDLSNKTPNFCSINVAFAQHGLATRDSSCP